MALLDEINIVREELEDLMNSKHDKAKIVRLSQQLDNLIAKYMMNLNNSPKLNMN